MANWEHLYDDPNGGSTGEAFFNTLNNNGFPLGDRLARESLQNSRDAVSKGGKLAAEFRFASFSGAEKKAIVSALMLGDLAKQKVSLGIKKATCLDHVHDDTPLRLLYVSDFNTTGLYGDPRTSSSHLRRLLLTLGDRKKQRDSGTSGGSYGFGKAVYSATSKIHTVVAYSRFDENADGGVNTRLMGCGYFPPHSHHGEDYSGRAIFGIKGEDSKGRFVVNPIENDDAHELAVEMGFAKREPGMSGASILIVDPQVTPQDLIAGIETWWWPALVEQAMDIVVYDDAGQRHVPKPRQRPDLRPYVDAFQIATGVAAPISPHQAKPTFHRLESGGLIGEAGLVLLGNDAIEKGFKEERLNTVALIRGPRMVVQYHSVGGTSPYMVGAFLASDDVESWLKISEPPAHDVWDHTSPDLDDHGELAKKAVKAIHTRLKTQCASFRKTASPPPSAGRRTLKVFENMFGRLFQSRNPGVPPRPPTGETNPVRIEFKKQPTLAAFQNASDQITFSAKFDVFLREDFEGQEANLRIKMACNILEDEDISGDDLATHIHAHGPVFARDEHGAYLCTLTKGDRASFEVESEPYDSMWSVKFMPTIEVVREDAE